MASNKLPNPLDDLFTLAEDMADGCHNHQTAIKLKQNLEVDVRADLDAAVLAQGIYKTALSAKTDFSTAVTVADSNGKAFIGSARRVLVANYGEGWSQSWVATGFPDLSTAVPTTQSKRQALLLSLKNFFAANPAMEVSTPKIIVTSALAGTLFTVSEADATLTGQPSGKLLKIFIIAANDAGQSAPSETVQITVP